MSKRISTILWVIGILLVIALVAYGAFRFGYMQGVAESPEIAKQLQGWQNPNNPNIPNYFHGFGGRMMGGRNAPFMFHRGFGIFSVFSIVGKILIFLLIAFLFMGMVRLLFFHPWRHPYAHWQGHMPPWAQQPDVQTPTQAEKPQEESK